MGGGGHGARPLRYRVAKLRLFYYFQIHVVFIIVFFQSATVLKLSIISVAKG